MSEDTEKFWSKLDEAVEVMRGCWVGVVLWRKCRRTEAGCEKDGNDCSEHFKRGSNIR